MKKVLPFLKPYKKQLIIGPLCKWIEALLELLLPTLMAFMVNEGIMTHNIDIVVPVGLLMILMVVIGFVFSIICQYHASKASQSVGTDLRNALFSHISTFSYEAIDKFGTNALSNRLINDVNQIQIAVAMLIRLVVRAPFLAAGALVMCLFLDLKLSLILLAGVPFIILILYLFAKITSPMYRKYQHHLDYFSNVLKENLSGVRVIRAFVSKNKEERRFYKECDELQLQMMKISRISALLNPLCALIINGVVVIGLWNASLDIERIDFGVMIAFINYASQILLALIVVSNLVVIFTKANASANRIEEILNQKEDNQQGIVNEFPVCEYAIVFDDVSFSYPKATQSSLENISFTLKQGDTLGIIGGTGSGKTTLVNLLNRAYNPSSGKILFYGVDIKNLSDELLNQTLTCVAQKKELFSGTILSNLKWGNPNASKEEIEKACRTACAEEFISKLENEYDAKVERDGTNFSGGQKQRLCIARGLLKKTKIMVLDDCFSALDFKTDAMIRTQMKSSYNMTTVIIAQRVGTIMNATQILVLDDGKIAGCGTHTELYENCKVYREICESQNIEKEAPYER